MPAYVEIRRQSAKGTRPHAGPDTYVAVQIVPPNAEPLKQLQRRVAERRGIKIIVTGEGYAARQATTRSALRVAIAKAEAIVAEYEQAERSAEALGI